MVREENTGSRKQTENVASAGIMPRAASLTQFSKERDMTKPMAIRMTDADGNTYTWKIARFESLLNVGNGHARRMNGWSFTSHDGCERLSEGAWRDLVPMFYLVAGNYGLTCNLS